MARGNNRLSAAKAAKAKTPGLIADGNRLYLQVSKGDDGNIRRSWILRYQRPGHRARDMGLGSAAVVGLADAREMARRYGLLLLEGKDPIAERDAERARNLASGAAAVTFDVAAESYIRQHRAGWRNVVHAKQWGSTLETYASPVIGNLPVADITTAHIMKVLNPIWTEKPETAGRVRGRIEAILDWAKASGHRDGENPARWRGHLDKLLPAKSKVRKVQHQPALSYHEMPDFVHQLRERHGMAALALEFVILTCVRTSDVRHGKRADIDRATRVWTIPRLSKTERAHRVPLSTAALAVLDRAEEMAGDIGGVVSASQFLFCNDVTGEPLSENAMLAVLQRMGRKGAMTTHGCRSTFRTWAQEQTGFAHEVAEMALGHTVGSKVERAYARGDALKKRTAIMQAWAAFLTKPQRPGEVIPLRSTARTSP
jgi:integrase